MKNTLLLALGLSVFSYAHAVDVVAPLGTMTAADFAPPVPGSLVSRVGANSGTADDSRTDQFTFTMSSAGSFVAKVNGFYLTDRQSTLLNFLDVSLYSAGNLLTPIGGFVPPGIDFTTANRAAFQGLAQGDYLLQISTLTSGTGSTAGYNITAHADYTAAVPEPSTYALLALGLGAVGLMRRSRMRREE